MPFFCATLYDELPAQALLEERTIDIRLKQKNSKAVYRSQKPEPKDIINFSGNLLCPKVNLFLQAKVLSSLDR